MYESIYEFPDWQRGELENYNGSELEYSFKYDQ